VSDANRVEAELRGQALTNDATGCASVNHRYGRDGRWNRIPRFSQGRLDGGTDSDTKVNDWADCLEIGDLRCEGRHVRRREDWK
jgi:hypothetical protein